MTEQERLKSRQTKSQPAQSGSLWQNNTAQPKPRPALEEKAGTEIAVIGGGMAGVLTAWLLKEAGRETVILEAASVGSGQTGRTTAKITSQHGLIYHRLSESSQGPALARTYGAAMEEAIKEYWRIAEKEKIDCGLTTVPAYLYTCERPEILQAEAEAAAAAGLPAVFTLDTELPFPVMGALRFEGQALFRPLDFLQTLAAKLRVYENTPVLRVEGGEKGDSRLITPKGELEAEKVVFATHYPFINAPGYYFTRLHQERSYVLALKGAVQFQGMYYGVDPGGYSFRPAGEYLLFGGGNHRTGENEEGGRYRSLEEEAGQLFPQSQRVYAWSAQDCMTPDALPYIGRYSKERPSWYVATGFNKWGMTGSMAAARLIRDLILDRENFYGDAFSPQAAGRLLLPEAGEALVADGIKAVKALGSRLLPVQRADQAQLAALKPGKACLCQAEGEKLGVYRDSTGSLHAVRPHCPHLGCQLTFNPDEASWDCPCHGSRFTYTGRLIDNPAQEDLFYEVLSWIE